MENNYEINPDGVSYADIKNLIKVFRSTEYDSLEKAASEIIPEHRFQLFNYLRITKKPIGLLLNFGMNNLYGERYYYDRITNECHLLDKHLDPL